MRSQVLAGGKVSYPDEERKGSGNESVMRGIIAILAKHSKVNFSIAGGGVEGADAKTVNAGHELELVRLEEHLWSRWGWPGRPPA